MAYMILMANKKMGLSGNRLGTPVGRETMSPAISGRRLRKIIESLTRRLGDDHPSTQSAKEAYLRWYGGNT